MQDKLEKEKRDAKNNLEEYIYEMRHAVDAHGTLERFVGEADRAALRSALEAAETWLYDDGEDQPKHVYVDKLAELRKLRIQRAPKSQE